MLHEVIKGTLAHLPSIISIAWSMKDNELLSSIDLDHGFYSLPFEDEASKTLQHSHLVTTSFHNNLSNLVMAGMPPNVLNYMDDYLVATDKDLDISGEMDTHLDLLNRLFSRLQQADLRLSPSKCSFFHKQVNYLGFNFSKEGLNISPKNIRKGRETKAAENKKTSKKFPGSNRMSQEMYFWVC